MEKEKRFVTAAAAVREVIATMEKGEFFNGYDLRKYCTRLVPGCANMYVETFLREMRKWCKEDYELISRRESLYRKVTPSRRAKEKASLIKRVNNAVQSSLFEGVF